MKKRGLLRVGVMVISLVLIVFNWAPAAERTKAEEFYKGKVIDFTSPSEPGGSIYAFIIILTPFIEKYTSAKTMVNVRRKGGGLEGYNYVYRSKPDGLNMGGGSSMPIVLNNIFESPGVLYDSAQFNYLGAAMPDRMVLMVNPKGPYQSIADLKKAKDLKFGVTSPMGNYSLANVTAMHLLELDAKQILGYKSSAQVRLAIGQGELAACCFSIAEALRPSIETKPVFVLGTERDPELPDVPSLGELVKFEGEKLKILRWYDHFSNEKVWYLPPGVDKEKIEYLREVYNKIIKDPDFISKSEKTSGRSFRVKGVLIPGKELQERVQEIIKHKEEMTATFLSLFDKYSAVK